ncbi:GNAT family N-acetyltransferase [Zobellia galactanivorans]|uniref:GCN5-related N-acetyltransferase n=1 Tax=Zobellia galactanivorans (strain DSM 12802 / CCUG 47099 / CIP 106680 / NCIMB 13871 / Dsij) TaxID=63186 RepID=G0L9S5_ZOBGA|nr:GNAT family N-acetyltransferase [Zobellia galactanivorans]MBU3027358.1 GNAT family N-acetyltransferase [Zobellia galactanivorans]CAZ94789.1 GCN5-related N-acetyltransferase [Zobellia galactanivorans]
MDTFKIRTAILSDLETLLEFEQGIIAAERPYDPTLRAGRISYYDLGELINSDDAEVVVVEHEGSIVASGYAKIKKAQAFLDHGMYSYLGFMYTHIDYRGKGLNKMVIDALKKWSDSRGISEVRLSVYSDNTGAIKAYEKAGFKKHIIEMRMVGPK